MNLIDLYRPYLEARFGAGVRRVVDDDRGATTAELIVIVGAAVVGAGAVAAILWQKLTAGANAVPTPSP